MFLYQIGEFPEKASTLAGGESAPWTGAVFEGAAGGGDRTINVGGGRFGDLRQHFAGGGIDRVEGL